MKRFWLPVLVLGGAALSAAEPSQKHNAMRLPSFRGIAEVRSSLPGRMRLYMPSIAEDMQRALRMKEQLETTGAVREVGLNPRTSTALILYDESQVEGAVVQGAAMKLMGLDELLCKKPESRMEKGLKVLAEAVNRGVLEATNGLADARILAGCALTIAGVKCLVTCGAAAPGAMTLLWWAYSVFRRDVHGQD